MEDSQLETQTLDEDPTAFLVRMKSLCPGILSVLGPKQAKLLSVNPTDPYDPKNVDEEYLSDAGGMYGLKYQHTTGENALRISLLRPKVTTKPLNVEEFTVTKATVKMILDRMEMVINSRLAVTEQKLGENCLPRVVRVSRKLKLTTNESRIVVYALIVQCGYDRTDRYGSCDCIMTSQFLEIPLKEILEFLSKDRTHMQQGFFPDVQDVYILNSNLTYDSDFCKAMMGAHLKSEEFLKIEQTVLADVVAEEPGNEHYRASGVEQTGLKQDSEQVLEAGLEQVQEESPGDSEAIEGIQTTKEEAGTGDDGCDDEGGKDIVQLEGKKDMSDLDLLLRMEREKEANRKAVTTEDEPKDNSLEEEIDDKLKPYKTDLEYLDDYFQLISFKLKVKSVDRRMEMEAQYDDGFSQSQRHLRQKREALTKQKVQEKKCEKRLAMTRSATSWVPRLERMVESRSLCDFEKNLLLALIGSVIQPNKFNSGEVRIDRNCAQVGELLQLFCDSLEEQIHHRKYFYKSGSLVREGMVVVHSSGISGDPSSATVEVDRRMLDFCVGLDTEFSEIVEGSHLYFPKTKFEQVILPKDQKQLIYNTVGNFENYKRCRKRMGLDDAITYGAGMVMLFHGSPGTGKTMMANALANKLNKKVLLINFPSLGTMSAGDNFKFIFREAKINDAILFFDECEAIFESREKGGHQVNLLLTEIERHDGLIILATNRPYDLDEAMHRRIMIALEFRQPDHLLRKAIWESHMPEQMTTAEDVDIDNLALRFELTGGFIKNAILSALSIAVSRDGDSPVVGHKDLLQGANLQLRGRLRMKDFDRRVVPNAGLDEVVVEEPVMKQLMQIVQFEKARSILFGQWGFAKRNHKGLTILLHGSPGTGKTLVAEAIGYEVGKPLKVINCGELLSKWVGESTKNIDIIFQEAQHQDAILVFDEAEGLFGQRTETATSTDRYANIDVGVLLYHIERFSGIVILTTNLIDNIDMAFFRRLRFVLQLDIPGQALREKLWKLIIPGETPLADDVDLEKLSHHEMSGGNIKNVVFRAAAAAALRVQSTRHVTMEDLEESCQDELAKTAKRLGFRRQDSDAARIYN